MFYQFPLIPQITSGHVKYEIADYWSDDVKESPIMIKEVLALKKML
jgi:hypothetical protein